MGAAHIGHSLRALSQRRPNSVVTIDGVRRHTGQQVCQRIAELSNDISGHLGVVVGERVALVGLNSDFYLEWLLAVPCVGAIIAPLNHRWSISEAAEAINRIEACLLVVDEFCCDWWQLLKPLCPSLRAGVRMEWPGVRMLDPPVQMLPENGIGTKSAFGKSVLVVRTTGSGVRSFDSPVQKLDPSVRVRPESGTQTDSVGRSRVCIGEAENRSAAPLNGSRLARGAKSQPKNSVSGCRGGRELATAPGGVALICFTSGTTGAPKAAALTHTALVTQSLAKIAALGYNDRDVCLHAAPLCHIGGISSALAMLMAGATHVFLPRWRVDEAISAVQTHHVTTFIAVPAMLADVIHVVGSSGKASDSFAATSGGDLGGMRTPFWGIRTLLVGGGPLGRMRPDVERLFPNAVIATAYGMTEAASSITFDILREPQPRAASLPRWITVEDKAPGAMGTASTSKDGTTSGESETVNAADLDRSRVESWAVCVGRPAPHLEIRLVTGGNGSLRGEPDLVDGAPSDDLHPKLNGPDGVFVERVSGAPLSRNPDGSGASVSEGVNLNQGGLAHAQNSPPFREKVGKVGESEERDHAEALRGSQSSPPFREGVIQVRGPNVFSGYLNQPEETGKVLDGDGWFSTGDVGYVDNRGRLWLCGREKDMVKTGGENVHAAEVEAILTAHPGVAAAAVVGLPDARLGEQVAALLVLQSGWTWEGPVQEGDLRLTAEDMRLHCHRRGLTRYKTPRFFAAQTGPLPVTSTGKVQKSLVRQIVQRKQVELWTSKPGLTSQRELTSKL